MRCSEWPPRRRPKPLHVALPGSVLSTEHSLQAKTIKAGFIARALAVHRVDHVWLFRDPDTGREDLRLLSLLLRYSVTPPHLKKRLFPLSSALRYVGLMPPLNLASHEVPASPEPGALMDGIVEECRGGNCRIFLGSLGYGVMRGRARPGRLVTVRIIRAKDGAVEVEEASWGLIYTGFGVSIRSRLEDLIAEARGRGFRVVATSRLGECVDSIRNEGLLIVFGGPRLGLLEYADSGLFDLVANTVHMQGARTVRTEEALHATLTRVMDPL
ncbi:MAG: hypothetical protein F7B18_02220 [Desulfurococcales archaeon]|nr:hypothetical protein [Desulfurococcales archaeon]